MCLYFFSVFDVYLLDNDVSTSMNNCCMNYMKAVLSEEFQYTLKNKVLVVPWRIFDIHAFPLHKKLFIVGKKKGYLEYSNIIHTKKKKKKKSLKIYLWKPKWLFYGIMVKIPFWTFIFYECAVEILLL